ALRGRGRHWPRLGLRSRSRQALARRRSVCGEPVKLANALAAAAILLSVSAAHADGEGSASLGYAVPAGSLERGSRVSDTTFGAVPIQLDGAYFVAPRLALRLSAAFAIAIPKLCASSADCTKSLGRDVALDAGVRFALPDVGPFAPRLDAGLG